MIKDFWSSHHLGLYSNQWGSYITDKRKEKRYGFLFKTYSFVTSYPDLDYVLENKFVRRQQHSHKAGWFLIVFNVAVCVFEILQIDFSCCIYGLVIVYLWGFYITIVIDSRVCVWRHYYTWTLLARERTTYIFFYFVALLIVTDENKGGAVSLAM